MLAIDQTDLCFTQTPYPSLVKYMGSKSKIMDFILFGINKVYKGGAICDLFSGSGSLAGAIGQQCLTHSNDIQHYSKILSDTYNLAYDSNKTPSVKTILSKAKKIIDDNRQDFQSTYSKDLSLNDFYLIENLQQSLINKDFNYEWHLFAKYYSGTWWSYEQCLWIDALREVANDYKNEPFYPVIISSIMFGMAYASQGTGHYAQYRDAKNISSLNDILIYRTRPIEQYFARKYEELLTYIPKSKPFTKHKSTSLDFQACLNIFEGGTVYADPPYCFVHYSRFYHAMETLVLYDFPDIQIQRGKIVKGRYRENRHQSPFCIKTQVPKAFDNLFSGINQSKSNLVLSYSNTGMIAIEDLMHKANSHFPNRKIEIITIDHKHMTLGRRQDRHRDVKECLLLVY